MALVTVEAVAIVPPNTSPDVTFLVQPVNEPFWLSCEEERVAGAEADILLAPVGMAPAAFQMSTVMLPEGLPDTSMRLIVQLKAAVGN